MRTNTLLIVLLCTFAWGQGIAASAPYTLDHGDKISIHVFREDNLSLSVRLNPEGRISYPFLGELKARGLTLPQLEKTIADGLRGRFLINPKVNISIEEYRPFFIQGEVKKPGRYPFQPDLNLRRALAIAGGITLRGSDKRIDVTRRSEKNSHTERARSLDIDIRPGDVINVGQRVF